MQPHPQWTIEIDIDGIQIRSLLHSRSGVIEDHKESSVTQCQGSLFGQCVEERVDFIALQIMGLRRWSAL